jgi:hypothetical protein
MRTFVRAGALALALLTLGALAQTPPDPTLRWVEVAGVSLNVQKDCGRYEFAAAVQALARKAGADIPQDAIVQKVYGSNECGPLGEPGTIADKASGDYSLSDSTVRLAVSYNANGPGGPDGIVVPLVNGTPYLLLWKKRPMVVVAAAFNRLSPSGGDWSDPSQATTSYPTVQIIRMLDPKTGGTRDFRRGRDSESDLHGTMQVTVSKR